MALSSAPEKRGWFLDNLKGDESQSFSLALEKVLQERVVTKLLNFFIEQLDLILTCDSPADIEGAFNIILAIAHFDKSTTDTLAESIILFATKTTSTSPAIFKILANLFNALPTDSVLRYKVFRVLLTTAIQRHNIPEVVAFVPHLPKWFAEWKSSNADIRSVYKQLSDALFASGDIDRALDILALYMKTFSTEAPPTGDERSELISLLVQIINNEAVFKIDVIIDLPVIALLADETAVKVLKIFFKGDSAEFKAFVEQNKAAVEASGINISTFTEKIRLIDLSTLALKSLHTPLSYEAIASHIGFSVDDVEHWIIEAVRKNIIVAKIDQISRSIVVSGSRVPL
ncbi:hypothetical protein H696_01901 [Fonticula alba]|uniref:PCI domain-containing protein n=1 Tax=Fonticula alba TaxID=691883 RepID=A0A058Z9I5_FONAL|nr:hypothetical protein H696_01901 [Fonticula alba]KCV70954.1 hypothetical protein H696_01901 [Fonticula alba]|eukprot:XP_009494077.1 hypothetical protein H696_01901 [Fonticula alba]